MSYKNTVKDYSQMIGYITRDKTSRDPSAMDQEPRNMYSVGKIVKEGAEELASKIFKPKPKPELNIPKPSILRREAVALDLNQINSISKNKEFEQAWKNYKISIKDVGRRKYDKDQFFEMWARENMADGGRMLNAVQMGEDRGDRTGFRKPIYVPTKKSYVVNDRTNNLIEDFKIEDYGSKSKAKKAADALDKKISAENKQRQLKISKKNRADFSNKRIDFKKSINTWTQDWMDNNIGNYDLQDADTFIKDMKEAFKDFNREAPTKNTAASIEGFPNIGTDAKGGKAVFTPYGIDSIKKPGKARGTTSYYDSFFRRAFLTNKIQTDDVLKGRISSYLDYATMNKPGGSFALDKLKLKYADTLNNLDDVMYVLSDDTQVVNLAKKNLLSNIFPQYNKFRKKKNASAISRKINIAKIEKTLGPKKLKELLNGGTSINKFLVDEGKTLKELFPSMKELPLGLKYSIDHNIGISELAKLSKSDMEKGLNSLIGMSNKRNTDLGWKGYSVIKKNLINKIQQGNDVSGNIDKLNEITAKAYPEELKGKKAYNLVNDKLTFTEDFTFKTNPEERFKSYFEEINKTPEGKDAIKKDFGSSKKLLGKGTNILNSFCDRKGYAGAGAVGVVTCSMDEIQGNLNKQVKAAEKAIKTSKDGKLPKRFGKLRALGKMVFGMAEIPIEGLLMLPEIAAGNPDAAARKSFIGMAIPDDVIEFFSGVKDGGKFNLEKLKETDPKAYQYLKDRRDRENFTKAEATLDELQPFLLKAFDNKTLDQVDPDVKKRYNDAKEERQSIIDGYQKYGYSSDDPTNTSLTGKSATKEYLRNKVKTDFENFTNKRDKKQALEYEQSGLGFKKDPNQKEIKYEDVYKAPTDLKSFIDQKGELGKDTMFQYGVRDEASNIGESDIFDKYVGDYAGVETPGIGPIKYKKDGKDEYYTKYGITDVRDAFSSLPKDYAGQLAVLEKEELKQGLKRKGMFNTRSFKNLLESQQMDTDQLYAEGGIADLMKKKYD